MDDAKKAKIRQQQEELEARILKAFQERHGIKDGYRRFKLLQETAPRIHQWLMDNQENLGKKLHPEHLEAYVEHLIPRVRGIIENVGDVVIRRFEDAPTMNHRIAMIVRCVNIMDQKADALRKQREGE